MSQAKEASKPSAKGRLRKWLVRIAIGLAAFLGLAALGAGFLLWYFGRDLPDFDSFADYKPPQVTRMFDRQGRIVAELYEEKRTVVAFEEIPEHVRQAFLAAEDADFYKHPGLDFTGMLRALWRNFKAGRVVEGGSTITQQVIKTLLLGPERSYARKIREVLLALRLESNLTKDEILSLYLNQIFFGHRCYGIQEASRFYFDKDVGQLALWEGALLAALPKSPALYSPVNHPTRALERRNWVLQQMHKNSWVSAEELDSARQQKIEVASKSANFLELAPYYAEHCRRLLEEQLGRDELYEGGLRVELAVDLDAQRAARAAMQTGLRKVDRRQGFRGPLGHLEPESLKALRDEKDAEQIEGKGWTFVHRDSGWKPRWKELHKGVRLVVPVIDVTGQDKKAVARVDLGSRNAELRFAQVKWARAYSPVKRTPAPKSVVEILSTGDLVEIEVERVDTQGVKVALSQPPLVQGALVAIEPENRHVLAMVGGSDFRRSPLIRAIQSRRQPGSAFKAIVYAAAIRSGTYTPVTVLMDTPEVYYSSLRGSTWKPKNFERVFTGPTSTRHALAHSINTVAVKITSDVGPDSVIETARAMGIQSNLNRNLSLALGSSEVTPLELTNAYATLAALGEYESPVFITSVTGPDGKVIPLPEREESRQALQPAEAFVVTSLLRSVVEDGTGAKARRLGRPLAGKTGTANQQRDAWFVGYSPDLATGVWVGFDDHKRMGTGWAQGAGTALPIWVGFMEQALADRPRLEFKAPPGVVYARIDPENGLLAPPRLAGARFEVFVEGTEPRAVSQRAADTAAIVSGKPTEVPGTRLPEDLYR